MFSEKDNINSIKVLDFGLSTENFESQNYLDNCGTLIYMAPEQISNNTYSKSVDIWSVGIILYMMLFNGKNPFYNKGDNSDTIIYKISNDKIKFDCFNNPISWMAKNLICKLLNKNPNYRYSARLALNHPWITENKYSKIPLTLYDKVKYDENVNKMKILFTAAIFASSIPYYKNKNIINYDEYLNKIKESNEVNNNLFKEKRNKMFDVIKLSRINVKHLIENKPKTADDISDINKKNNNNIINNENHRNNNENNKNTRKLSKIKKTNIIKCIYNNKNKELISELKSLSKDKKNNIKNNNISNEKNINNQNNIILKKLNRRQKNTKIIIESKDKNKPKTSLRKNSEIPPFENKKIISKEFSSKILINNKNKLNPIKNLKTIREKYNKK
jgi:serine/threonine protein kinase